MTSSSQRTSWGFLFVALSAILFGSIGVATKGLFTLSETNALSLTLLRALIALPVLTAIGLIRLRGKLFAIPWRDLRLMIFAGLMMALYQVAFVMAVQLVNVTIATLVTLCTVPVLVAFLSSILFREHLQRNTYLAMGCAIAGVVLLIGFQPIDSFGPYVWFGIALALITALCSGLFQMTGRVLANRYHPFQTLTVFFLVAALAQLPFALASGVVLNYPPTGWALLVHLGIGVSVLGYAFLMLGLKSTPATIATIIGLLEPLTSTLLAWLIFNEQLGMMGLVGASLLLAAMVIIWRTNTTVQQPGAEVLYSELP